MSAESVPRIDRNRAALVRELRQTTSWPEKSIYRWLSSGSGPCNAERKVQWDAAVAAARTKLGLDGSAPSEVAHAG